MIFSKRCSYAILAMTFMSAEPERMHQVKEIADATDLPYHFLGQILRELSRKGLLNSTKGKSGGFQLTRCPCEYSLLEIRGVIDENKDFQRCYFCTKNCSQTADCPFRVISDPVYDVIERNLSVTSLSDMTKVMKTIAFHHV